MVWRLSHRSNLQLTQNYGITARKDPELSNFVNLRCDSTEPTPHILHLGRDPKELLCVCVPDHAPAHIRLSLRLRKVCTNYHFHKLCLATLYPPKVARRSTFKLFQWGDKTPCF